MNLNPKTEHLEKTKWKKGKKGGPGRPKGVRSFKVVIRELLEDKITIEQAGKEKQITKQQAMALKQIDKAIQGADTQAFNAILDRIEGKPHQTNIFEGGERPIRVDLSQFTKSLKKKSTEELQQLAVDKDKKDE
jgi:protein involved in temperature-dependent protein secretion